MPSQRVPYQSPPGSFGNDGALPTAFIPLWNNFSNLTDAQILAFQSFPQDLTNYTKVQRLRAEISGVTVNGVPLTTDSESQAKVSQLKQAFDDGIITSQSIIDAAGNVHTIDATAATALYTGVVQFIHAVRNAEATLIGGINSTPATITTRKQIDAVFGPLAPNSASALNPSQT